MSSKSKNIIGDNFSPDLVKQIETRQQKLGKSKLDTEDIIYNNSRNAWLRVASSVEIKDFDKTGLGGEYNTVGAKDFILFGGVTGINGPSSTLQPIATTTNDIINDQIIAQYGIGNHTKWGFDPPPSVTSMEIQALNKGSIRKATLMLTAHNPDQFRIIELLYLRLGFSILVEWGHNMYYDNDGNLQSMGFSTTPFTKFFDAKGSGYEGFSDLNKKITKEREKYNYNYDAFVGFVSNFTWSIGDNGEYNINLTAISPGALIESLTANRSRSSEDQLGKNEENKAGNKISSYLQYWKNVLDEDIDGVAHIQERYPGEIESFTYYINDTPSSLTKELYRFNFLKSGEILKMPYITPDIEAENEGMAADYYVSLGALLRLLEKTQYKDKKGTPIINIDSEYGKSFMLSHPFQQSVDKNTCIVSSILKWWNWGEPSPPSPTPNAGGENPDAGELENLNTESTSSENIPSLEIQPQTGSGEYEYDPIADAYSQIQDVQDTTSPYQVTTLGGNTVASTVLQEAEIVEEILESTQPPTFDIYNLNKISCPYFKTQNSFIKSHKGYQADMMGIMLNMDFVISQVSALNGDTEGNNISILNFLNSLLAGVNNVMGKINSFTVAYDEDLRKATLYDERTIPGIKPQNPKQGVFNIKGFETQEDLTAGSFIKNFSFQTKVFPNLTNLIAISAQTGEIPLPDEGSSFQVLNKNLVDRIMGKNIISTSTGEKDPKSTIERYSEMIEDISEHFHRIYVSRVPSENRDYASTLADILKFDIQTKALSSELISPFFIPVTLNLEMDGLAGMTLWQKFDVTPDYILPPDYPNNLDFIIKGINHAVKDNGWVTSIDTLCWPKASTEVTQPTEIFKGDKDWEPTPSSYIVNPGDLTWEVPENGAPFQFTKNGDILDISQVVSELHPQAQDKWRVFLSRLEKSPNLAGYKLVITSTYRTVQKQTELYATNPKAAKPGTSPHNLGVALDINILPQFVLGDKLTMSTSKAKWIASGVVDIAQSSGFRWGGTFEKYDPVHFDPDVDKNATFKNLQDYAIQAGKQVKDVTQNDIYNYVDLVYEA